MGRGGSFCFLFGGRIFFFLTAHRLEYLLTNRINFFDGQFPIAVFVELWESFEELRLDLGRKLLTHDEMHVGELRDENEVEKQGECFPETRWRHVFFSCLTHEISSTLFN